MCVFALGPMARAMGVTAEKVSHVAGGRGNRRIGKCIAFTSQHGSYGKTDVVATTHGSFCVRERRAGSGPGGNTGIASATILLLRRPALAPCPSSFSVITVVARN